MSERIEAQDVVSAIEVLTRAGAFFALPQGCGALSLMSAARWLDLKPSWVRAHLVEFPGWYRLPAGGSNGRNCGEIRIPVRDLERFEARRLKARVTA